MNKFDESKHPRDSEGKFTKKELESMSARELSERIKLDTSQGNKTQEEIQRTHVEKAGAEYNLTQEEISAVHKYVNSFNDGWYKKINQQLRDKESLSKEDESVCKYLDTALDKISKYKGNLLRVISLDDEQLKTFFNIHKVGENIVYDAYTSTTSSNTEQMKGNVCILFTNTKKGTDLRKFNPKQSEILYKRGSTFVVTKIEILNNRYFVFVKER